ncbi:MAG: DUF3293 domain-containing protein [Gemmatimonadetes bacterium]|nr:DUF3293 domain-containing protein [Gemmatimonadota bacterium]
MQIPDERDAELLASYGRTRWLVTLHDRRLSLSLGDPFPVPDILPAAIVTACNPASRLLPEHENLVANERLRRVLLEAGASVAPALARGSGADADLWDEPGYLVSGISLAEAVSVAASFGQNAIVWVDRRATPVLIATRTGFYGASSGDLLPTLRPPKENAGTQSHEERPANGDT